MEWRTVSLRCAHQREFNDYQKRKKKDRKKKTNKEKKSVHLESVPSFPFDKRKENSECRWWRNEEKKKPHVATERLPNNRKDTATARCLPITAAFPWLEAAVNLAGSGYRRDGCCTLPSSLFCIHRLEKITLEVSKLGINQQCLRWFRREETTRSLNEPRLDPTHPDPRLSRHDVTASHSTESKEKNQSHPWTNISKVP